MTVILEASASTKHTFLCHDMRKVAYVPLYTCETVLAPFEKAGYQLKFYELDQDLHSIFDTSVIDEISVLSLCGYYGFCNYDHDFVKACKEKGVVIFEDVTHLLELMEQQLRGKE